MNGPDNSFDIEPAYIARIVVVGASCSGKTTLAKRLSQTLLYPHIELDALHWLPNWVKRDQDEFLSLVKKAITQEQWVVDGNYSKARALIWSRATTILWLNWLIF